MKQQLVNNGQSTLSSSINALTTSISVDSASTFATSPSFVVKVDSELMLVTGVSGTTFTVTRGYESTTAAAHNAGATVSDVLTASSLTQSIVDRSGLNPIAYRATAANVKDDE